MAFALSETFGQFTSSSLNCYVNGDYWDMSRTPAIIGSLPAVGEHNEEILSGILGYSDDRIAELRDKQVISESDHDDEIPG